MGHFLQTKHLIVLEIVSRLCLSVPKDTRIYETNSGKPFFLFLVNFLGHGTFGTLCFGRLIQHFLSAMHDVKGCFVSPHLCQNHPRQEEAQQRLRALLKMLNSSGLGFRV